MYFANKSLSFSRTKNQIKVRFIIKYASYLENIQADSAALVHIGVVDLCDEPQLGRLEGVSLGQQDLQLEHAAAVRSVGRAQQHRLQRVRLVLHL